MVGINWDIVGLFFSHLASMLQTCYSMNGSTPVGSQ